MYIYIYHIYICICIWWLGRRHRGINRQPGTAVYDWWVFIGQYPIGIIGSFGNWTVCYMETMAPLIDDLTLERCDFPVCYVGLADGLFCLVNGYVYIWIYMYIYIIIYIIIYKYAIFRDKSWAFPAKTYLWSLGYPSLALVLPQYRSFKGHFWYPACFDRKPGSKNETGPRCYSPVNSNIAMVYVYIYIYIYMVHFVRASYRVFYMVNFHSTLQDLPDAWQRLGFFGS